MCRKVRMLQPSLIRIFFFVFSRDVRFDHKKIHSDEPEYDRYSVLMVSGFIGEAPEKVVIPC